MKMLRQNMVQETFYKCHNRQRGCFPARILPGIFKPEFNYVVFHTNYPVIAYGSTMRVSANIFDNFPGACKRRFGKDHPFFGNCMEQPLLKR